MNNNYNKAVAYLPATTVLAELNQMIADVGAVGVEAEQTTMGGSFADWSAKCQEGQTAWLYSLDQFHSITELVAYGHQMAQRGVLVRSVREPWFNDPEVSGVEVLNHLFELGQVFRQRAMANPPTPLRRSDDREIAERVRHAIELLATQGMSVVAACRMAGCGVTAYYRILKAQK